MAGGRAANVCVTGMHRSGTSFAARSLELLGVDFGDPAQLMGPGPDNPTGYWENRYIKELDDELLAHLGGSWDQPPVLDPGWASDPALEPFRVRAATRLEHAFASDAAGSPRPTTDASWRAWKDPRLSLLLPFWRTVAPVDATIVILRDPLEVAASLGRRNAMPSAQACMLWLRYVLAARIDDPGQLALLHRHFFDDLPGVMARMAAHLDLPAPTDDAIAAARTHVDPSLQHHRAETSPASPDPVTELTRAVWNEGDVQLDLVPDLFAEAIARGWMRAPLDTEALDRARAKVVELTERLRRRARERRGEKQP